MPTCLPLEIQGEILSHLDLRESIQLLYKTYHSETIYGWKHALLNRIRQKLRIFAAKSDVHLAEFDGPNFNPNSVYLNSEEFGRLKQIVENEKLNYQEQLLISEIEFATNIKSYDTSMEKLVNTFPLPNLISLHMILDGSLSNNKLRFLNHVKRLEIEVATPDVMIGFHHNICNLANLEELHLTILYPDREYPDIYLNQQFQIPKMKKLTVKAFAGDLDIIYHLMNCSKYLQELYLRFNETGLFNLNLALSWLTTDNLKVLDIVSFQDDDNRRVSTDWEPDLQSLRKLQYLERLIIDGVNFTSNLKFLDKFQNLKEASLRSTKDPEYSPILEANSVVNLRYKNQNLNLEKLELDDTYILSHELVCLRHCPNLINLKLNAVILKQFFNFNFLERLRTLDVTILSDRLPILTATAKSVKNIGWPPNLTSLKLVLVSNDERKKYHSLDTMLHHLSIMQLPHSMTSLEIGLETTSRLGKESIFNRTDLHVNAFINSMLPPNLQHLKLVGLDKYFPQWQWWNMKFLINTTDLQLPQSLITLVIYNSFIEGSMNLPNLRSISIRDSFFKDDEFLNSNFAEGFKLDVFNCCYDSQDLRKINNLNNGINISKVQKTKPEEVVLWRHNKRIYLLNGPIIKSAVMA
ncbi:hypothetical protein CANARDRAFT_27047 [[Candida] arabinofermentans NRRL YB-2248]|uniref:F-box domain-containing protein n=1 Tax=[Candida] arabinofermentans NRRL YB-2248 TaxID=983967 RepID=A0A1E4T4D7_9ASCO|nr:hypothetical protein CANARDRAFT_27047 [[Candida] arabinofermentans NRRL YB-2248]